MEDAMHEWEADRKDASGAPSATDGGKLDYERMGKELPAPTANDLEQAVRDIGDQVVFEVTGRRHAGKLPAR